MPKEDHPKLKETRIVYRGFFDFREDTLMDHQGNTHSYNCLVTKADGVAILPEIEKDHFLLTIEYRHPVRRKVLSCPGGRVDHGEEPIKAAKRELLEESGYEATTWIPLHLFYPFPSACDQKVYLYLAKDLKKVKKPHLDPLEEIEMKIFSLQELKTYDSSLYPIDGTLPTALFYREHLHIP